MSKWLTANFKAIFSYGINKPFEFQPNRTFRNLRSTIFIGSLSRRIFINRRSVYLVKARECTSHNDCTGIQQTSCVRDGNSIENPKMRCLCGNNKAPVNGQCANAKKRKLITTHKHSHIYCYSPVLFLWHFDNILFAYKNMH